MNSIPTISSPTEHAARTSSPVIETPATTPVRAVIGVDREGTYRPAMQLFAKLSFQNASAELLHVDKRHAEAATPSDASSKVSVTPAESRRDRRESILSMAKLEANLEQLDASTAIATGGACDALIRRAEKISGNLIVIGSAHNPADDELMHDRIGRGLAARSHQSVLIAKNEIRPFAPLTAVFATDCSPYADECLAMFMRMRPRGVAKISVLTAVESFSHGLPPDETAQHVDSLVKRLRAEGFEAEALCAEGKPAGVIDETMDSLRADLLILASPHHRLVSRLLFGSLSLQEVANTPHSVLLLRKNS